ncbi:zincin-like metallopeptidase domain-containing protein [Flavobacterium sp. XS2P12]|uniref:zincin-like metallopeptidase domain-containing protein n=1 Tax=Flavobacterium melibiosi TaxID=3398734 RepID=UPI003A87573B
MSLINQFNGLGGAITSRESLNQIRIQAIQEGNTEIASRIANLLLAYPEASIFELENDDYIIEPVPSSFLHGLDYEAITDEPQGLGKVSPTEVYDMITAKIVKMIEAANSRDYKKTWEAKEYGTGYTIPFNFASKKRYRGVNVLMLTELEPLENPFFLTFKQIKDLKGKVKKGAKGFEVVYFTKIWKAEDRPKNLKFSSYDKTKVESFATENGIQNDLGVIPMLKYYHVYNGKDIEGIDFGLDKFKIGFIDLEKPADEANRMPIPEAILKNYPKPQPTLKFGGNRAFYSPGRDLIQMPYLSDFDTVQDYYRTLLHEYSHSTGASKRLSRDFTGSQGSKKYAFEELVAELGAIFLSAEAGIVWHNNKNHAAYLKGWNSVLTQIKDDNKFIMKAGTAAQKVADFVLQFDEKGDPLYFEDLKKAEVKKPIEKPVAKKQDLSFNSVKKGEATEFLQNEIKIATVNKHGVITWHKKGLPTALRNKIRKAIISEPDTKKTKERTIVAYAVVDNITAEIVATKITLPEIIKFISENYNPKFHNLQPLVYEVENINGKNKLTNKIDVSKYFSAVKPNDKKKTKEPVKKGIVKTKKTVKKAVVGKPNEQKKTNNPEPFAIKPESTAVQKAVNDIVALPKYQGIKAQQAQILYKNFKDEKWNQEEFDEFYIEKTITSGYEQSRMNKETIFHSYFDGTLSITEAGFELVTAIKNRLESLHNQNGNYALFEGLKVPIIKNNDTGFTNGIPTELIEVFSNPETPGVDDNETKPTKNKLMQMHFESLPMGDGWENFMQNPAKNMKIAIWGPPKNGKTAGALQFANYLTKFGNVLYNFADQGFNLSTQELWKNSGLADNSKAEPSDSNTLVDLEKEIATGKYTFVFIDMISDYIRKEKISPDEFKTRFIQKYPNVSFILIFEVTKGGNFKGDQGWTHVVDAIVTVENFLMENRGRYGMGYHIVWEEGFKRFAPKRYEEIAEFLEPEEELEFTDEVERI